MQDYNENQEFLSPIDALFDEDNSDNIVIYNEDDEPTEFEQVAVIVLEGKVYAILKPALPMDGVEEDEAIVFAIEEVEGESCLIVEEDDAIVEEVFEEYYNLLRQSGVDVD